MEKVLDDTYLTNNILSFYQSDEERIHRAKTKLNNLIIEIGYARWVEREFFLCQWNTDLINYLSMDFHIYLLLHIKIWKENKMYYGRFASNVTYADLIEY